MVEYLRRLSQADQGPKEAGGQEEGFFLGSFSFGFGFGLGTVY